MLLEQFVVQDSEDGLGDEDDQQNDTDDWVCVVHEVQRGGHVDTHPECNDIEQECEALKGSVNPEKAGEASNADQDASDGEEGDDRNASDDPVCQKQILCRTLGASQIAV